MQLILETESSLDVQRKMSTIDVPLDEKVVANGDVENLKDKNCNGVKENLVHVKVKNAEEIPLVNNGERIDDIITKALADVEDALLYNDKDLKNNYCVKPDEGCVGNNKIVAPILESPDNNVSSNVNTKNSDTNHGVEKEKEELKNVNILSANNKKAVLPEILDNTKTDPENDVDKEFDIDEESPVSKDDINLLLDKIAPVSSDDTVDISNKLESPQNYNDSNKVNSTQATEVLTKDTEMIIEEENKPDIVESEFFNEETSKGIPVIPDVTKDVKESEPIEDKNIMDVDKVLVEPNNDTCDIANLNKDQTKAELIDSQDKTGADDPPVALVQDTSDTLNSSFLNKEVVSEPLESEHKLEVEESKDILEDVKSEERDSTQTVEGTLAEPNDLRAETSIDDVECISEVSKSDSCCMFKFPKLDEGTEGTPIEVQDGMEVEEIKDVQENVEIKDAIPAPTRAASPSKSISEKPVLCRLSNTLDILSDDDDEEPPNKESQVEEAKSQTKEEESSQQQSINIEDDDDIMLIDEEPVETELKKKLEKETHDKVRSNKTSDTKTDMETGEECNKPNDDLFSNDNEKESTSASVPIDSSMDIDIKEKPIEKELEKQELGKPLVPENFLLSAKKNLADMTRDDLEEFCVLKIVESIVDRSSLSDIKAKLIAMTLSIEEYRKKAMALSKQNRDLQVVLKSVQEEQKKKMDTPINPLKITRSVGMQVLMLDKTTARRKALMALAHGSNISAKNTNSPAAKATGTNPRKQKPTTSNQNIPVPRLVPANSPVIKPPSMPLVAPTNIPAKASPSSCPVPNGIKPITPAQKTAEKRQHNRIQAVTVDLTDDEPPAKMNTRSSPAAPVRLVSPQNLMAPQRQPFTPAAGNSPRKVYIPISGPQNQAIRTGQTIMLKTVSGPRPRCTPPQPPRMQNPLRRVTSGRHPAPLPDAMKQYQPPNWKALPPAPDLRLSKVENGIVISWKIEGYQEDSYEEIASYQLYAYQETTSPPSTSLWKKIGDVKALPLPMACTLTQFMAGFKYYFAVRAVDVKCRLGPFSLPGSILLLNKL